MIRYIKIWVIRVNLKDVCVDLWWVYTVITEYVIINTLWIYHNNVSEILQLPGMFLLWTYSENTALNVLLWKYIVVFGAMD